MSNNTCILHTSCNAHSILHRLKEIADSLNQNYRDVDLPYHACSTTNGELFLTEFSHAGKELPIKISQIGDRQLLVEIVAPVHDDPEKLRAALAALTDAYLSRYTNPEDLLQQEFRMV